MTEEFPQEAVRELASYLEQLDEQERTFDQGTFGQRNSALSLLRSIGRIANKHDIDSDDRVDFACAALKYSVEKKKMEIVSDFRESLEEMEALFK